MKSRRPDLLHATAFALQRPVPATRTRRALELPLFGALGLAAVLAHAQENTARPALTITPEISLRQTATDNARLSSNDRQADLVTEVSPELRLSSNAGRIKGFFDYTLHGLVYARHSSANTFQQSLSAAGVAEAVENWAFVDASASISQQNISALGTQSADTSLINPNRTEVASLRVSPYLRGRLGNFANYEARLAWQTTKTKDSTADSSSTAGSVRVSSDTAFSRLGWAFDYSHQTVDFAETASTQSDRLTGTLLFAATPELRFSVKAGQETNDLVSLNKERYDTWGAGVAWSPSERTRIEADYQHRFFGSSNSVRIEHRMPRSVWSYTDTRDVSSDAGGGGNGSGNGNGNTARTVFDLLFSQFASIAPDPIQRAALVDAFLLSNGLSRTTLASGGFLTSAVSVQRRQDLSFALLGVRSTVIVSAFRNDARRLDAASTVADDLSNGNVLRQQGFSVNLSHRLTPLSALSVAATLTKTSATVGAQSTELKSLIATFTSRLREHADLSVSARRASFNSDISPYTENAVTANLRVQF